MRLWSPFWTFSVYPYLSVLTSGSQAAPDSGPTELEVLLLRPPHPKHLGACSSQRPHIRLTHRPLNIVNTQATAQTQGDQHSIPLQARLEGSRSTARTGASCYSAWGRMSLTWELGGMKCAFPVPLPQNLLFNQICVIHEPGKALRKVTGSHLSPSQVSLALI